MPLVEVVTPPASYDLTTLATVKEALGLTTSDHDSLLARLIAAASGAYVEVTNRWWAREQIRETFRGAGWNRTVLTRSPVISFDGFKIGGDVEDETELISESPETGLIGRAEGFPKAGTTPNIEITYTAGYVTRPINEATSDAIDLPADVEQAVVQAVGILFKRRDKIEVQSERIGDYAVTYRDSIQVLRDLGSSQIRFIV